MRLTGRAMMTSWGVPTENMAWIHLIRGEREAARRERDVARTVSRRTEGEGWTAALDALLGWADDPVAGHEGLMAALKRRSIEHQDYCRLPAGSPRLGAPARGRRSSSMRWVAFLEASAGRTGPIMALERRWVEGLVTEGAGAAFDSALEAVRQPPRRSKQPATWGVRSKHSPMPTYSTRAGRLSLASAGLGDRHGRDRLPPAPWTAARTRWFAAAPAGER